MAGVYKLLQRLLLDEVCIRWMKAPAMLAGYRRNNLREGSSGGLFLRRVLVSKCPLFGHDVCCSGEEKYQLKNITAALLAARLWLAPSQQHRAQNKKNPTTTEATGCTNQRVNFPAHMLRCCCETQTEDGSSPVPAVHKKEAQAAGVRGGRRGEVLPVQRGPGQRAIVSHVLTAAMTSTSIKGSDIRAVADGKSSDGSVVEPVDFSDDAADQRWQAELQRARQEADLERARQEAETKALLSVTEHWMSDVSVHATGTGRSTWWSADEPPPPLLSDSDSFCSCDDDDGGDDDSWLFGANVAGGAHAAARGGCAKDASLATAGVLGGADRTDRDGGDKRGAPADKRGKTSRKVAAVSAMASAQGAAAPPPSVRDVTAAAEPRATTTDTGDTGAPGAMGASGASNVAVANMERWASIKRWVERVAEGWMVPRKEQLWHYFRDRIDGGESGVVRTRRLKSRILSVTCPPTLFLFLSASLSLPAHFQFWYAAVS